MSVAGGGRGTQGERRTVGADKVRQGPRDTRIFWVLAVSLTVVALAFVAIWAAQLGPGASRMNRTTHREAAAFNQNPPQARQNPAQPSPSATRNE